MKWFKSNGGKMENVEFPSAFGSVGYVGVSVKENIPAYKVF